MHRRRPQGFTLMEVLVVLVITGLVSTVLMQALSQAYGLQQRFNAQLQRSERGAMEEDWFRQIVQGLLPDLPDSPGLFYGDEHRFHGLAIDPFSSQQGVPALAELTLDAGDAAQTTRMVWRINGSDVTLADWRDLDQSAFVYIDDQGQTHDQWPPPLGLWPALPAVIELRLHSADQDELIVAVPRATFRPLKPRALMTDQP